ncbi:hypothetical protein [Sedimenticola selenatireducens]|uniref:hypothetical protein n=1 Tax=Sedimenticola selenatireducens TaxID=191960 RepID=UPI00048F0204|nr:hypothetical protein [Sedimenticola selenatireducens]
MRYGALGPRALKLYLRNGIIFVVSGLIWWGSFEVICLVGLKEYAFWLSFPFWLVAALAILGIYSIGPLGKGFKEAVIADEKEEKELHKAKQPWE